MTDTEKKFLEQNFKAGEYASLTILVKLKELDGLIATLKSANLTLAILPSVQSGIEFASDDNSGKTIQ